MTNLDTVLKRRDVPLPTKVCIVSYGFSSSHVEMWELDQKQGWVPKNWCFWAVVLEKTLESPLDSKEIKPVDSKEKLWIFTLRIDAKAETLILWTPNANSQCIWKCKRPFSGVWKRPWYWERLRQEEKGTTEDEIASEIRSHHRLNVHEFEQSPGDSRGQGSPACCSPWGLQELDMTEWLNSYILILEILFIFLFSSTWQVSVLYAIILLFRYFIHYLIISVQRIDDYWLSSYIQ